MRRLTYIAVCATLLIAVTGAIGAKYLFRPSMGCTDRLGRTWHVTGSFHGEVRILDAQGHAAALLSSEYGEMREPVEVASSGETFTIQGVGWHEIHGKGGALFGYVVLQPLTEKDYLARGGRLPNWIEDMNRRAKDWADPNWDTHGGVSGTETAPWGARGFDIAAGLRWRMLGTGHIAVFDADGQTSLAAAATVPARMAIPEPMRRYAGAREPELHVTIGKQTWNETGYGRHELKDEHGTVLLVVIINRKSTATAN